MVTGERFPVVGVLKKVPISFGDSTNFLYLLVDEGAPFEAIIGYPSMEDMNGILDLGRRQAHFTIAGSEVTIPIPPHYPSMEDSGNETDTEYFTSATSATLSSSSSGKEMVITIQ